MAMRTTPERMAIADGTSSNPSSSSKRMAPGRPQAQAAAIVSVFMEHAQINNAKTARAEQIAASMAAPVDDEHRTRSALMYWLAFAQLKQLGAPRTAWDFLAQALNIAMILAEDDIGGAYLGDIIAAQEQLFRAMVRGERMGVYRLDDVGIPIVAFALEVHDAQIAVALRGDLAIAERKMEESLAEGNVFEVARRAA